MAKRKYPKQASTKRTEWHIWNDETWVVNTGRLVPPPGRPRKTKSIFRHVAEKIPYAALDDVRKEFNEHGWASEGVYVAHDSMGYARYVGRGSVFHRLKVRKRQAPLELAYFSFYIVANKNHEREIETLMIRLGGPHLHFNERKKRVDIAPGSIRDYEAGTRFVERQRRRGRSKKKSARRNKV
ncbi:MAG: hypothetical protein ACTS27_01105 [Phycisphaerales bacterium]